jgi:hypothetical protein
VCNFGKKHNKADIVALVWAPSPTPRTFLTPLFQLSVSGILYESIIEWLRRSLRSLKSNDPAGLNHISFLRTASLRNKRKKQIDKSPRYSSDAAPRGEVLKASQILSEFLKQSAMGPGAASEGHLALRRDPRSNRLASGYYLNCFHLSSESNMNKSKLSQ